VSQANQGKPFVSLCLGCFLFFAAYAIATEIAQNIKNMFFHFYKNMLKTYIKTLNYIWQKLAQ